MTETIPPVPCPRCGQAQNITPGGFDPEADPFGPVTCMVCGYDFGRDEYLAGRRQRLTEERGPGNR